MDAMILKVIPHTMRAVPGYRPEQKGFAIRHVRSGMNFAYMYLTETTAEMVAERLSSATNPHVLEQTQLDFNFKHSYPVSVVSPETHAKLLDQVSKWQPSE